MKRNGRYKCPAKVRKQQVEKKLNALFPRKEYNSEIMINDLDTQFCIEKLSNGLKDSKPDNDSDGIFPSSGDVFKYSVKKNYESSNTDCGSVTSKNNIKDSNVTTGVTKINDKANAKRLSAYIKKMLHNEIPDERIEWSLHLSIQSNSMPKISKQDLHNIVINKTAEIMATRSHLTKHIFNISICKEQQRLYYKKYRQLLNSINTINSDLNSLNRMPDNVTKHVRNVGTSVNMPKKKQQCSPLVLN